MKGRIRATVKYGNMPQREKRFVKGTPQRVIKQWKLRELGKMMKRSPQPERKGPAGSLTKDAERYYPLVRHLADWVSRRSEIRAWLKVLGDRPRHVVTRADVLRVRGEWTVAGVAVKTINNRISALRNLYRLLDGDDASTPCDGVKPLTAQKVPPTFVDAGIVQRVLDTLETSSAKHARQDRARLMVLASTGKRPCELERAVPQDVDLRRKVWLVRDAKGGFGPGVFLNDEMVTAWEEFVHAEAWGKIPDHFPRRLRAAGWPEGIRPYNLRHSTWIEASERGADLADIQAGAGHRHISTTRLHYVPVLNSRMQRLSERLDGRFGWNHRFRKESE